MDCQISPTFRCLIASVADALLLIEACLEGCLNHLPRKRYRQELVCLAQAGNVYIYEENASGFKTWDNHLDWTFIGNEEGLHTFMAVPLALRKVTASLGFGDTTHHLVAYQPIDDIRSGLLKRPPTSANLRDLELSKKLHLN